MAFKPIDPKRDEFRRYLERSGVIEALTKVFVRIVKERPENPLDYLRHNLGDSLHQADSMAYLQNELEEARSEIQRLRGIIESVNPDALRDQQHLHGDIEKDNVDENADFQENAIELISKPQEESQLTVAADTGTPIETSQIKDKIATDDHDKNLEAPEDTNIPMPENPAQIIDNNS